ncbi:hypothetical protein ACP4OV_011320 [Aristida adscensionis]
MASRGGAFALCSLLQLASLQGAAAAAPLAPAIFVFGDSTVDVGNNNYLPKCDADCKADHPRFGVDYLDHAPTGRFSNGYNLADQLAQLLGFPGSPPALLSLPNASLVSQMSSTGINFASGGSGLLNQTGGPDVCGEVLPMSAQVQSFKTLAQLWGSKDQAAADRISKSLIFISVGSNDLFEYSDATPDPSRDDAEFLQGLVTSYTSYLKDLYSVGARRFSVVSPSLVGCCPSQRLIGKKRNDLDKFGCLGMANNLSTQLNPMIASMLHNLSAELSGMSYSLGDSIAMAEWVFTSSHTPAYDFTVLDSACCGTGEFNASGCSISVPLCQNRTSYLFWDEYHLSEAATAVVANELFGDTGLFVHPINVQQLVTSQP